ncbi:TPA: hypothetical protein N0F65_007437 [Lagenidium giganteum]|uniref:RNA exonuclease 4 n=1 Tax=Lagenidium giganteum TaxID=4803 RepID=A0AAV2ZIC4_9STRA|nr:TPA: hypothetical protein N0F65_007437 [Lagenidium giganteum]
MAKRKRSSTTSAAANAVGSHEGNPVKKATQTEQNSAAAAKSKKDAKGGKKPQHKGKGKKPAAAPTPAPAPVVPNSNWLALKAKIQKKDIARRPDQKGDGAPRTKKNGLDVNAHKQKLKDSKLTKRREAKTAEWIDNDSIVAMDCEMVGVGMSGKTSVLARCSIVDYDGNVLYDKHVRPVEKVTDFRTHVSGIRSRSLKHAIPFAQCLKEVGKLLKDKIVVGHALKNDFKALMFAPPKNMIRDTAKYRPYMRRKMNGTKLYPKSLKNLAAEVLGKEIQQGEHDSVIDARTTLELYKREQFAWEKYLRTNKPSSLAGIAPPAPAGQNAGGDDDDDGSSDEENPEPTPATASVPEYPSDAEVEASKPRKPFHVPDTKELQNLEYAAE